MNTRKHFTSMLIAIALTIVAPFAKAQENPHNPYTVLGVQLRSVLLADQADGSSAVSLGPAIFQEIVPCRFISTLEADHYPAEWGGPAFAPNESRSYRPTGQLVSGTFVNPCSEQIPAESLAIAARVWATGASAAKKSVSPDTIVWLTPGTNFVPPDKLSKVVLRPGEKTMAEASVVLQNHMFTMTSQLNGADLAVDIIGYFIKDTWGNGAKGDKGDQGNMGPAGPAGATGADGAVGPQGPKGDAGAQGAKGDKGDQGIQGEKGLQGDKGLQGEKGLQGDKGADGAQGAKGDKGDQGSQGIQGANGEKGEKGDRGDVGPQGAQGAKGDAGPQGYMGPMGPIGPIGPIGPMGPQGPTGPQGPKGTDGLGAYVSGVSCIGQGDQSIMVSNSNVHVNSAILLTVTGRSLGNVISVLSQSEGSMVVSGKPATCFRYVILN